MSTINLSAESKILVNGKLESQAEYNIIKDRNGLIMKMNDNGAVVEQTFDNKLLKDMCLNPNTQEHELICRLIRDFDTSEPVQKLKKNTNKSKSLRRKERKKRQSKSRSRRSS
jgi:hypothetical protein